MRRLLLAAIILTWTGVLHAAEPTLTVREAQNKMDADITVPGCGVMIPVGEFKFTEIDTYAGGTQHELAQRVAALKEAGAIDIINLPGMIGFLHFRTEVAKNVDASQITGFRNSSAKCVAYHVTRPTLTVVKVDIVKGGSAHWDGAIIYSTVTNKQVTDLYRKYATASKMEWRTGDTRVRALWKYDLFKNSWDPAPAVDVGPLNGSFTTNMVPEALQRD